MKVTFPRAKSRIELRAFSAFLIAISFSSSSQPAAHAHSLDNPPISIVVQAGSSTILTNQTDGCPAKDSCTWEVNASNWPGSVEVTSYASFTLIAPSPSSGASSGPFTITLTGNKRNGDFYRSTWVVTISGFGQVITPTGPSPVLEVSPSTTPESLTITCDATTNGGSAVTPTSISYTVGQPAISCSTPVTRSGYTFLGWFTSSQGGSLVNFPIVPVSSATYFAQWKPNTYTITCDATTNGGTAVTPTSISYTVGQPAISCSTPAARSGYTFLGWFTTSKSGSLVNFPIVPVSSATYFAQWKPNTYTITCDATTNGGTAVTPTSISYTVGDRGVSCSRPSLRTGYAFNGWYTAANGGSGVSFPVQVTQNTTFYAQWTPLEFQIQSPDIKTSTVVVYFGWDKKRLTSDARNDLKAFVENIPTNAVIVEVKVTGFAQVARSRTYDLILSQDRADVIAKYLEKLGVNSTISTSGQGWDEDTPESRRGEVKVFYTLLP